MTNTQKFSILLMVNGIAEDKSKADQNYLLGKELNIMPTTELGSYRELEEFLEEIG